MPATLLIVEAANLYVGDWDPTQSNHLTLANLKLPALEENYSDWMPGGAPVASEVDTHFNHLEATFTLYGMSPWVFKQIGQRNCRRQTFTAYGLVRDRRNGCALELKAVMEGHLAKADPTEYRRGEIVNHEYAIRGITHYELYLDDEELMWWDMFISARRVGGEDLNRELNDILRIPAAGVSI